jgi:hypothetical protein
MTGLLAVGSSAVLGIAPLANDMQLANMINDEWPAITLPDAFPSLVTPSPNHLILLSRIVLSSLGISPLESSDTMRSQVRVRVSATIPRQEPNLDRFNSAVVLRAVGIPNRVELMAMIHFDCQQRRGITVKLYRNLVGCIAVVFDEQIDELSRFQIPVYFFMHETQQMGQEWVERESLAWLIGWNDNCVESRLAKNKIRAAFARTASDFFQLCFRFFLRRSFLTLLPNLTPPLKQTKDRSEPAANGSANEFGSAHAMPNESKLSHADGRVAPQAR